MKAKQPRGVNQEIPAHRKGNLRPNFPVKYHVKCAHCYLNVYNRLGNSLKNYQTLYPSRGDALPSSSNNFRSTEQLKSLYPCLCGANMKRLRSAEGRKK